VNYVAERSSTRPYGGVDLSMVHRWGDDLRRAREEQASGDEVTPNPPE
jgi:hypothetical protein